MQYLVLNIALFLVVAIFISIIPITRQNRRLLLLAVAFLQLMTFHVFKDYNSLPDLDYYVYAFDALKHVSLANAPMLDGIKAEPGWMYMTKVLSSISESHILLFLFTSTIIIFSYIDAIRRYSPIVWLSVFLFLIGNYNQSLFVLRQHVALALCIISYPLILNKRLWCFLLVIFLAYSVHQTALIFLPTYFLYHLNWKPRTYGIVLSAVGVVLFVFMGVFLQSALQYTMGYESYVDSDQEGSNVKMALLLSALLLWRLYTLKAKAWNPGINKLLTLILIVGCMIQIAGTGFVPTNRLNMYYSGIIFLIFPNTVIAVKQYKWRVATVTLFTAFMFYLYIAALPFSSEAGYRFLF